MAIDFPNAPTVNQLWPSPATPGVPVWKWTGAAWVQVGGTGLASIYVADTPPAGAPANSLWWESDTGLLYVNYNDGDSIQWVIAVPGSDIANYAIRFDQPQTLTTAQQVQARSNIFAAPFDALAYSGIQVNGSMDVSQEVGTSGTQTNGHYAVDGFQIYWAGTMALSSAQQGGFIGLGMNNILAVGMLTAEATLGANDYAMISTSIEGYRAQRLAWGVASAQPITIGFWTAHHPAGNYSGAIRNGANNRSCVFTYTQNVADAWEYKTVTLPGDTAGTWLIANNIGMMIDWSLGCGANYASATTGSWLAANILGSTSQVNLVASTSNQFRLSGVIVLPGIEAPNAARSALIMRPYDQELQVCRRYLQRYGVGVFAGHIYSATVALFAVKFDPLMRIAPTFSVSSPANWITSMGSVLTSMAFDIGDYSGGRLNCGGSGLPVGQGAILQSTGASPWMQFDARL